MMSRDGSVKIGVLSTGVRKSTLSIYKIPDENLANAVSFRMGKILMAISFRARNQL